MPNYADLAKTWRKNPQYVNLHGIHLHNYPSSNHIILDFELAAIYYILEKPEA